MTTPRYTHDCKACQFMGRWDEHDVWVCPKEPMGPSVIARQSDDPPDYASGPIKVMTSVIFNSVTKKEELLSWQEAMLYGALRYWGIDEDTLTHYVDRLRKAKDEDLIKRAILGRGGTA